MADRPWMTDVEIEMLDKYLTPDTVMLEYGSGGSTIYYANKVKKLISVEHEQGWFNTIEVRKRRAGLTNIENICVPVIPPTVNDQRGIFEWDELFNCQYYNAYKEYVNYPLDKGYIFDVVFIDGRCRPQCAKAILDTITRDSVVFIHDYNRRYYGVVESNYDVIERSLPLPGLVALRKKIVD